MVCLFPFQLSVDFRRANSGIASDDRHDLPEQHIPRLRGRATLAGYGPRLARRVHDPIPRPVPAGPIPAGWLPPAPVPAPSTAAG